MANGPSIHRKLTFFLQGLLLIGCVGAMLQARWLAGTATLGIVLLTFLPVVIGRRFGVNIPPEFEALAVLFVYASLFLGEVRGYYVRFWWWDVVLHGGSGFLIGILGFLMVYILNEQRKIALNMNPGFVSLFAFMFSLGIGAIWEIFEFAMDQWFGFNMQKSGLVDTMWDLIVDAVGALIISVMGWGYLRTAGNNSFLERWISSFVDANPRLFRK